MSEAPGMTCFVLKQIGIEKEWDIEMKQLLEILKWDMLVQIHYLDFFIHWNELNCSFATGCQEFELQLLQLFFGSGSRVIPGTPNNL